MTHKKPNLPTNLLGLQSPIHLAEKVGEGLGAGKVLLRGVQENEATGVNILVLHAVVLSAVATAQSNVAATTAFVIAKAIR